MRNKILILFAASLFVSAMCFGEKIFGSFKMTDTVPETQDVAQVQANIDTHEGQTNNPHGVTAVQIPYYTQPVYESGDVPDPSSDPVQIGTITNFTGEALDELFYQSAMKLPRSGGTVGSLNVNGSLRVGDMEFIGTGEFLGVNMLQDGSIGVGGVPLMQFSNGRLAFRILSLVVSDNTATITIDGQNVVTTPFIEMTTNLVEGVWTNAYAEVTGPVDNIYTATVDVSGIGSAFFRAVAETARGKLIEAKAPIMSIKQPQEDQSFIRLYSYGDTNSTPEEVVANETLRIFRLWNDGGTARIDFRPQGSSNLTVRIDSVKVQMPMFVMIPQSTVPSLVVGGFYVSDSGNMYVCRSLATGWELFQ